MPTKVVHQPYTPLPLLLSFAERETPSAHAAAARGGRVGHATRGQQLLQGAAGYAEGYGAGGGTAVSEAPGDGAPGAARAARAVEGGMGWATGVVAGSAAVTGAAGAAGAMGATPGSADVAAIAMSNSWWNKGAPCAGNMVWRNAPLTRALLTAWWAYDAEGTYGPGGAHGIVGKREQSIALTLTLVLTLIPTLPLTLTLALNLTRTRTLTLYPNPNPNPNNTRHRRQARAVGTMALTRPQRLSRFCCEGGAGTITVRVRAKFRVRVRARIRLRARARVRGRLWARVRVEARSPNPLKVTLSLTLPLPYPYPTLTRI